MAADQPAVPQAGQASRHGRLRQAELGGRVANWPPRRDDQAGCLLFSPLDRQCVARHRREVDEPQPLAGDGSQHPEVTGSALDQARAEVLGAQTLGSPLSDGT